MRRALRVSAATAVVFSLSLASRSARATSVEEYPDNGSEQQGRGGAWVARASDPLATFYNPAGLAGQPTRLTLQANIATQNTCFTRVKAANDTTNDNVAGGAQYPQVCSGGSFFPDPQLGFTWHITDRLGVGILILGPSAVGNVTWPEFVNGQPAPQRYLLLKSNVVLLTPTVGVGYEVIDRLRLGAAFVWGLAPNINFANAAPALNADAQTPGNNDVRAELTASQMFIPGVTAGVLWSPIDELDVAGWYKGMASIDAKGDAQTASNYFTPRVAAGDTSKVTYGDTSLPNCNNPALNSTNPCGSGNNAEVKVPIPMEAKVGVRYHMRRDVVRDLHSRDPMAQDVFDVEADFTWANNSAFDSLQLRFPGTDADPNVGKIPANPGIPGSTLPPNADVRHHFKDVFGVRLGGDYNVLPDQLAIRAGAFFETTGADTTYQNIDFDPASRIGLSLGGSYRIKLGAEKKHALDFMLGYGHVFFAKMDNSNPNGVGLNGLAGSPCNPAAAGPGQPCPSGTPYYRTNWPINLGTITSEINVINVGAAYRF